VVEVHSIGSVLNVGFGVRGVQYWFSTKCRVSCNRGAVLNAGSIGRVLSQY
jgi:hypothetical protein